MQTPITKFSSWEEASKSLQQKIIHIDPHTQESTVGLCTGIDLILNGDYAFNAYLKIQYQTKQYKYKECALYYENI